MTTKADVVEAKQRVLEACTLLASAKSNAAEYARIKSNYPEWADTIIEEKIKAQVRTAETIVQKAAEHLELMAKAYYEGCFG